MNRAERRAAARGKSVMQINQGGRWAPGKKKNSAGRRVVTQTEYTLKSDTDEK